ncbi:MAG: ABC transporter ATP-binding protein, partial [Candidatus Hodarchaeales archaeon]
HKNAVISQELNTFIISSAEKRLTKKFDTKIFDQIEKGTVYKRLVKYYGNIEARFRKYLKNDRELNETLRIIEDFVKEIDPELPRQLDNQLRKVSRELPRLLFKLSCKSFIAVWDIKEYEVYRFYLSGLDFPPVMGQNPSNTIDVGNLVDKLVIVNFFLTFLKPTLLRLEAMQEVLDRLERELGTTIYRVRDNKLQSKYELFIRILVTKLSALQEIESLIGRIFNLFEIPWRTLSQYGLENEYLEVNAVLSGIERNIQKGRIYLHDIGAKIRKCQKRLRTEVDLDFDTIPVKQIGRIRDNLAEISTEIRSGNPDMGKIDISILNSQSRLQDLEKQVHGIRTANSVIQFKKAVKPLAEISVDLFVEAELLKIWGDFFGSDIPYFSFNTRLFNSTITRKNDIKRDVILATRGLFKNYNLGKTTVYAIRGADLDIREGEFVAILGNSGAGKTTLLNCMAGLDEPDHGAVYFRGKNLHQMKDADKSKVRLLEMGFIFQNYALIPHFNTRENVALPADIAGFSNKLKKKIEELLVGVGIDQQAEQFPAQLSGGQMQRVAIARALTNGPAVIFADEPTGDLDTVTGKQVMDLLKLFHRETGTTIIIITHEEDIAAYAERQIVMEDGIIKK